jgi:serine/threonine-protein kinase RsbW
MREARALPINEVPDGDWYAAAGLERVPESAEAARRLVRDALASWGLLQVGHPAGVVVTELVSNAVRHTRSTGLSVSVVRLAPRRVCIGVLDQDRRRPEFKPWSLEAESGRGLLLIDAMASAWGVDVLPDGKRVWALLEASP